MWMIGKLALLQHSRIPYRPCRHDQLRMWDSGSIQRHSERSKIRYFQGLLLEDLLCNHGLDQVDHPSLFSWSALHNKSRKKSSREKSNLLAALKEAFLKKFGAYFLGEKLLILWNKSLLLDVTSLVLTNLSALIQSRIDSTLINLFMRLSTFGVKRMKYLGKQNKTSWNRANIVFNFETSALFEMRQKV